MSKKLMKIEEKRETDIQKLENKLKKTDDAEELTEIEAKKAKNIEKMYKYQQKKQREFK